MPISILFKNCAVTNLMGDVGYGSIFKSIKNKYKEI